MYIYIIYIYAYILTQAYSVHMWVCTWVKTCVGVHARSQALNAVS